MPSPIRLKFRLAEELPDTTEWFFDGNHSLMTGQSTKDDATTTEVAGSIALTMSKPTRVSVKSSKLILVV